MFKWLKSFFASNLHKDQPFFGLLELKRQGNEGVYVRGRYFDSGSGYGYNGTCRSAADGCGDGEPDPAIVDTSTPEHQEIPEGVIVVEYRKMEYWFDGYGRPVEKKDSGITR